MLLTVILAVVYLIGIFVTYNKFVKAWEGPSSFEKILFSLLWPFLALFYIIHYFHNKW